MLLKLYFMRESQYYKYNYYMENLKKLRKSKKIKKFNIFKDKLLIVLYFFYKKCLNIT